MTKFIVNTDGGARGNPGPAAVGILIKDLTSGNIEKIGKYLGIATNNIAEYAALKIALEKLMDKNAEQVQCFLDSELVVKQLNGEYKVKDENLKIIWLEIKKLETNFKSISYTHIPRAKNKEADKIVNEVLDAQPGVKAPFTK